MKIEIVESPSVKIHVPDESDDGLMECARSFDSPFTAEEFCMALYKSQWGMGSWVSGKLRRLKRLGKIKVHGKHKGKTLYHAVTEL